MFAEHLLCDGSLAPRGGAINIATYRRGADLPELGGGIGVVLE